MNLSVVKTNDGGQAASPLAGRAFLCLLIALAAGGAVTNLWQRAGEAVTPRAPLAEFPAIIGNWQKAGADERFSPAVESVLRADDYISRSYRSDARGQTVWFYVGYYATQRTGATYHSPLNCLPGAGWTMQDSERVTITPTDGSAPFAANRYIIANGSQHYVLLYWYQGRGRAVASEYWGKIYTVLDSIGRRRSDGALVRVLVPLGDDATAAQSAYAATEEFAAQAFPYLSRYVPD